MKINNLTRNILLFVAFIAPFIYTYFIWDSLPERVATHFGADGNPDQYGAKGSILVPIAILMVVGIGVYFLLQNIDKFDPKRAANTPKDKIQELGLVLVLFMSGLSISIIQSSLNNKTTNMLFIIMSLFFIIFGNLMHSLKPSYIIGIRLPWTLENEYNWRKTHQLASKTWVVGDILMLISSFFVESQSMFIVLMLLVVFMVLIPAIYSFRLYKKGNIPL